MLFRSNPPPYRPGARIGIFSKTPGSLYSLILTHHSGHAPDTLFYPMDIAIDGKTPFVDAKAEFDNGPSVSV